MRRTARAMLLGCLLAAPAAAQTGPAADDSVIASFIRQARSGTAPYHDRAVAIADGFRRIGVEFPAMGEHWVNPVWVLADTFDISRPAMLTYIMVDGTPVLAGVGYTALLEPGEVPPDFAPATGAWHEHNGSVIEESLPHHHRSPTTGAGHAGHAGQPARRLSVLHAWVWVENPAGVFVTDNWALPAHRLGIAPDERLSRPARHMITLGLAGTPYYVLILRGALSPSVAEEEVIARVLEASRSRIGPLLGSVQTSGDLDEETSRQLDAQWAELWNELMRDLPRHAAVLEETREQLVYQESGPAVD